MHWISFDWGLYILEWPDIRPLSLSSDKIPKTLEISTYLNLKIPEQKSLA